MPGNGLLVKINKSFNPRPQKGPAVLPNGFKAKINCYRRCQSHTQISEPEGDATVAMKKLCTESKNPISVDEINAQGYNAMSLNEIKASEKIVGAYPNLNAPSVHRERTNVLLISVRHDKSLCPAFCHPANNGQCDMKWCGCYLQKVHH